MHGAVGNKTNAKVAADSDLSVKAAGEKRAQNVAKIAAREIAAGSI